jgi:hypothetical protein
MRALQQLVGVAELPLTFLETGTGFDASDYTTEHSDREIDSEPLTNLAEEAMRRFSGTPEQSDGWLAPRLHHVLRLTRREAARRGVWAWLAVVACPKYVHWRFPGRNGTTDVDRFLGREDKNAIGRLWWGAELMRNGGDYGPVVIGFSMQDIPNTWMRLDAFHNRALVQAVLAQLATYNGEKPATSDQVNAAAKAINTAARTILIDAVASDEPPDGSAIHAWVARAADVDETTLYDAEPEGPLDDPVSTERIAAMKDLVVDVIGRMPSHHTQQGNDSLQALP